MHKVEFTPDMVAFVVDRHESTAVHIIAEGVGVSLQTLRRRLPDLAREHGLALRRRGPTITNARVALKPFDAAAVEISKGETRAKIAKRLGVSDGTLRRHLKARGVVFKREDLSARDARIVQLVGRGASYAQAGRLLGVSKNTVTAVMQKNKKPRR